MSDVPRGFRLDRRTVLASGAALAVGLAGCNEEGGDRAEPQDLSSYVPASAAAVVHADMALTESQATRDLLSAHAGEDGEDLLRRVERETGVDPENVDEALVFSEEPGGDRRTLVVAGDIDEAEVRSAAEERSDADYEAVDHDNGTVYSADDPEAPSVGTVAEGQYVVGDEADVKTALDVFAGDEEGLQDPLRGAFEDVRSEQGGGADTDTESETGDSENGTGAGNETDDGETAGGDRRQYVASATDQPRAYLPEDDSEQVPAGVSLELYEELETATATYAAGDGEVAIDVDLRAPDEETAASVRDFTGTILAVLRSSAEDQAVAEELARVSVERDGSVVTVDYRSDAEGAATLVGWLGEM